jgi:hypothetical protein
MARELENAAHKEKAREWRSRAFQNGSRVEIASFSEWLANRKNTEMKKNSCQPPARLRYVKIDGMNDIDNKIKIILPVETRFVVQSASRGARRSDAQEVHVEVPCNLHVEAQCARR